MADRPVYLLYPPEMHLPGVSGWVNEAIQVFAADAPGWVVRHWPYDNLTPSKTVTWEDAVEQVDDRDTTFQRVASLEVFYLLREVSGRDQAVLRLRLACKGDAEIAEKIGVSPGRVPVLYHCAVKRLQQKFRPAE